MEELIARRDAAAKLQPSCKHCGSKQMQLTSWFRPLTEWRCRSCKTRTTIEVNNGYSPTNQDS